MSNNSLWRGGYAMIVTAIGYVSIKRNNEEKKEMVTHIRIYSECSEALAIDHMRQDMINLGVDIMSCAACSCASYTQLDLFSIKERVDSEELL